MTCFVSRSNLNFYLTKIFTVKLKLNEFIHNRNMFQGSTDKTFISRKRANRRFFEAKFVSVVVIESVSFNNVNL